MFRTFRKSPTDPFLQEKIMRLCAVIDERHIGYESDWDGEILDGDTIALDCETEMVEHWRVVPHLVMVSASSGGNSCIIRPERISDFLVAHRDREFVFHNVAFDFWVIEEHLRKMEHSEALTLLWPLAHNGRLHDTMLLDQLIGLADTGARPVPRDLAAVAEDYAGLSISKDDPCRTRYGELIGVAWEEIPCEFLNYAIKDAIVTFHTYVKMVEQAQRIVDRHPERDEAWSEYGLLTETIQVKAAIALAAVTRNGIRVDLRRVKTLAAALQDTLNGQIARIRSLPQAEELFKTGADGNVLFSKAGFPRHSKTKLQELFLLTAEHIRETTGRAIPIPRTPKGFVATSVSDWREYVHLHPFLGMWFDLCDTAKLLQFVQDQESEIVHPSYMTLVRTGRTSCYRPNIQQIPRAGGVRECFVPSDGHVFALIDYKSAELVTLAAVLEHRYGASQLAEVIRAGIDPHAFTAAMVMGVSLPDFMELKRTDPDIFREQRQRAKAINFGIPGGLGAEGLRRYAKSTYGVGFTLEEAESLRMRLIHEVYPELARYLSDDPMATLAANLRTSAEACWQAMDFIGTRQPCVAAAVRNVVGGATERRDGTPYNESWYNGVWDKLMTLNQNPELTPLLPKRQGSRELRNRLFAESVATLTGRIRGRVSYCQARNAPFQGLAADAGKLALFDLVAKGFRVVAFVHDEVIVELPVNGSRDAETERIVEILRGWMKRLTGLPADCDVIIAQCWTKDPGGMDRGHPVSPSIPELSLVGATR